MQRDLRILGSRSGPVSGVIARSRALGSADGLWRGAWGSAKLGGVMCLPYTPDIALLTSEPLCIS